MRDIRYAFRSLLRNPGFAAVAVLTIGLGIGASTAVFSVVNGVLLKPLPYRDSGRLVVIRAEQDYEGARRPVRAYFPAAAVDMWPSQIPSLESVAFYSEDTAALAGAFGSEPVSVTTVSGSFFSVIDGDLAAGRALGPSDDRLSVVVISERLWRQKYDAAPSAIGQNLTLNGRPATIVGIASSSLQLPLPETDIWLPPGFMGPAGSTPIARLKPGFSAESATQDVTVVANRLAAEMPRALAGVRVRAVGLHDDIAGEAKPALLLLFAAAGLLLMLACANVMNLMLARGVTRSVDTAVRRALGASRGRLVQQSLAEGAVLAAPGAAAGIAFAAAGVQAFKLWTPSGLPRLDAVRLDGSVMLFACAVAAMTALAAGIFPALRLADIGTMLKSGFRSGSSGGFGGPRARFLLRAVTVLQLTISVVLLVGAVLLSRSLASLLGSDLGVRTDHVATAALDLTRGRPLNSRQQVDLVQRVLERVRAIPSVTAAGAGTSRPPDLSRVRLTLNRTDAAVRAGFQAAGVPATSGYFEALGIRLERGRLFTDMDSAAAPPVAIVSAYTARLLFGDEDPLGRTIDLPFMRDGARGNAAMTIVGVTADVKYAGLDQMPEAIVYRPLAQQPWSSVFLVVRAAAEPSTIASQLRREIGAVDPSILVSDVTTLDSVVYDAAAHPRFRTLLLTTFAAMAVTIASVGLYGVVAYSMSRRTNEIGIRMALGADRRRVMALVFREGMMLALFGNLLGLAGAYNLTQVLGGLLYGINPTDAKSFALAACVLFLVSLIASYVPARRACRVNPIVALKSE